MSIKQLKRFPEEPLPPKPKLPRCEALASAVGEHAIEWRKRRYADQVNPLTCSRDAVVELDGHYYCRIHGGFKALELYLTGKLAKVAS